MSCPRLRRHDRAGSLSQWMTLMSKAIEDNVSVQANLVYKSSLWCESECIVSVEVGLVSIFFNI